MADIKEWANLKEDDVIIEDVEGWGEIDIHCGLCKVDVDDWYEHFRTETHQRLLAA